MRERGSDGEMKDGCTGCAAHLWREHGYYDSWRYEHGDGLEGEIASGAVGVGVENLFAS